jgi:transposase-like protein
MSGHSEEQRFVVVAEARRRWSRPEKEAIVAELASGAPVSAVARKHNIAPSLLFRHIRTVAGPTMTICASWRITSRHAPSAAAESCCARLQLAKNRNHGRAGEAATLDTDQCVSPSFPIELQNEKGGCHGVLPSQLLQ